MRKRLLSMLLLLCMTLTQILSQFTVMASAAAEKYFKDEDVTWIGTEKEYKKTLEAMFDQGLRKVPVGNLQADGSLKNIKYGLVDSKGRFASEPIYDEIKAYYISATETSVFDESLTEIIFVDGYTQAVRNGKMGLLDTTGKEVIPCQYDAVGLPVEGCSRIIKKSGDKYYLGYWSLAKGKEIVKPNKYPVSGSDATAEGTPANYEPLSRSAEWEYADEASDFYKSTSSYRVAIQYDFNGGYALVPTGKVEYVDLSKGQSNPNTMKTWGYLVYAQVIDTNGKEILSGGPYPYRSNGIYPQAGPYMIYQQLKKEKLTLQYGGGISFNQYLVAGVVGKKGVLIKAQYHGGIRGNAATGWFPADANMQIIPEYNLFITAKDVSNGKKEGGARTGVINVNNKTVIPFESHYEFGPQYDSENKIIITDYIYKMDGTKISKSQNAVYDAISGQLVIGNGYFHIYDDARNFAGVVSVKTGKAYTHKNLYTTYNIYWYRAISTVSADDTMWVSKVVENDKRKWGLVNLKGKIILPFEYDYATTDHWARAKDGYALVQKDGKYGLVDTKGKVHLSCKYWSISEVGDYFIIRDDASGLYGVYNRKTGKIDIPCSYLSIGNMIEGTFIAVVGPSLDVLINDKNEMLTEFYLGINKAVDRGGLYYNSNADYVGPDGRIVFPRIATVGKYNGNTVYYGDDLTIVVKDGKVGYINASRLATKSKGLPTTPLFKTEPSPLYSELKYRLVAYPYKQVYKIGEPFEIKDFILHSEDVDGTRDVLDNSKVSFVVSNTVKVTDGYKFTTAGIKKMECYYDGVKTGISIEVLILDPAETGELLDNGTYTISVYGKYLKIVNGYIELWDTKPADKFTIKLVNYSKDKGPKYRIMTEDGQYLAQPSSSDGDQLIVSNVPHDWRINHYSQSKFTTIRDYGKQKLVVNASGQKSSNGTKIIVWSHSGSAPDNAKLTFTPVK